MNIIFKPECKTEIIEPTYDLPIIGEPISKTGASANNSNAYGVIVGIIGDGSSRRVRVMTEGYIDYDKVTENYMEYTDEAINALTGITLCSGGVYVPKPLTYDYMPEGYPTKSVQTITLMEKREVEFALVQNAIYVAQLPNVNTFEIVEGQIYTVNWDGAEYKCACFVFNGNHYVLGNLSIMGVGDNTGEPFVYEYFPETGGAFSTLDTSASHTISVTTVEEVITPMAEKFLPYEVNELIMNSSTTNSTKKFKITVDDSGTISATEIV